MAKNGMIIVNSVNRVNNVNKKGVMMQKKPFLIGRTFIVFTIIASMTIPQIWAQEKEEEKEEMEIYLKGKRDGKIAGEIESARGCGCISGCCLGPFGCLLFPRVKTEPPFKMLKDIEHKSEIYKTGFRDGFKEKKKDQFNKGVIIGTAAFVVGYVVVGLVSKKIVEDILEFVFWGALTD